MIPPLGFEQDHLLLGAEEPPIEAREDPRSEVEPRRARERDVPAHLEVQGLVVHQRGAAQGLHGHVQGVTRQHKETERIREEGVGGAYKEDALKAAEEELLVERKRRLLRRTRPRHLVDQAEVRRLY